jgi:hypothetical protein
MKIASPAWNAIPAAWTRPAAQPADDPQSKRLQQMQEGLAKLKAMPAKLAQDKAGYLQRRLLELKQLLLHASPEQAKALMKELKSIAGELAAVAKDAAAQGGDMQAAVMASGQPSAGEAVPAGEAGAGTVQQAEAGATAGDSSSIKDVLTEARRLLKEALTAIKAKLAHGRKEAQDDLRDAEKKLGEIDDALSGMDSGSLYTSLGESGGFGAAAESIPSISVTV